ncbi:MAG: endonuclease [Phycisphaerales bacterium]|nr:endonuclease [Phycisphaerales bacterium]
MTHRYSQIATGLALFSLAGTTNFVSAGDGFEAPASYYSSATGTGPLLKTQLTSAMSAGHIQRSYGDFRSSASIHDADPNNPGNILLVYNLASVSATWDSGSTWNREHVWPQSRQPGSASNSTRGNLGDPHALRPSNPSVNSSRGNKPFGNASSTGGFGSLGTFYFPGDTDKGDVSRSLFYSATRYASSGLNLVNGNPGSNQMGDLNSLVTWHYLDVPDTFERRRNHAIYSSSLNPAFRTNNRNAYVDHPEFVWSVFMDQMNDTTLWFGDLEPVDGASSIDLALNALVGDTIPSMMFELNKGGNDGTYYTVSTTAGLTTSHTNCYYAFAMSPVQLTDFVSLDIDPSVTANSGSFIGDLRVDNLDVTTLGGAGNGSNDVDDIIFVNIDVYEPGQGSFDSMNDVNSLNLDLGTISMGSGDITQSFSFFNLASGGAFGAPIDVELLSSVGDTTALNTSFTTVNSLAPAGSSGFNAILDDNATGTFSATYTFRVYNDQSLFAGSASIEDLVMTLSGVVEAGDSCAADFAEPFGQLNFFDVSAFLSAFSAGDLAADMNDDGALNFFDVSEFLSAYAAGCP